MTVGNRFDNTGAVTTNNQTGTSIGRDVLNKGFLPFQVDSVTTYTATTVSLSGSDAGLTYLSGTSGVITVTMPSASTVPGAMFVLRTLSADAHILTCSEAAGTKVFCAPTGSTPNNGSKLTLAGVTHSSVVLFCDGHNYLVVGGSGSNVFSGT